MKFVLSTLVAGLFTLSTYASGFSIETDEGSSRVTFYAKNTYYAAVTVLLTVDVENMEGSVRQHIVIPPRESDMLFELKQKDMRKAWRYSYKYSYHIGEVDAAHSEEALYNLPFKKGSTVKGGQGFNGSFSHYGIAAYAVDFPVPVGTPVYPAREGTVVKVIEKYSEGGTDERFKELGNAVWIMHSDNTLGKYLHFKHNGVLVEPGQKVGRHSVIGLSGNTGYSTAPHLHFEVGAPNEQLEFQSYEFSFSNKKNQSFSITSGKRYRVDR